MIAVLLATVLMKSSCAIVRVVVPPGFAASHEQTTTLPPIETGFDWNEAIVSWNVGRSERAALKIEAQAVFPDRESRWFTVAEWTGDLHAGARHSVLEQSDADGKMDTDTLHLNAPCRSLRLRVTTRQVSPGEAPVLKLLAVSFSNTAVETEDEPPFKAAWGKTLEVPERSQMTYEHGKLGYDPARVSSTFETWFKNVKSEQYCSPTSSSMILDYWAKRLGREELNVDVPEVVAGVFDEKYPGTGNWPFNTAYMGSFEGMRSYVARLRSVADLERLIDKGVPVVCSVAYNLLKATGKPRGGDGHLVVLVGFTKDGDPIFNDPGRSDVRQIYRREDLAKAWAPSHTVYIAHPETVKLPTQLGTCVLSD